MTGTSEYRYLFADLLTNQVYAELPLFGVSFNRELNTAGSFNGQMLLSDSRASAYNVVASTIPARTAVYVERNNVLVWGGILWSRSYDSTGQTMSLTATEFESYFTHRRIVRDYDFIDVDQLTACQQILNNLQALPNGNIGVIVGTETSNVLITKSIYDYELKPCLEFIYEMSRGSIGFDFNIDVAYGLNNVITKTLRMEYPRRGRAYSPSDPTSTMLEFPANVISYSYPEDGSKTTNTLYGVGGGQGENALISIQQDAGQLSTGWALLENSVSYTDYDDPALLAGITQGNLLSLLNPVVVTTVTFPTETLDPLFGTYNTGDDVRLRITDDRFPNTLDVIRRISSIALIVGDNGADLVTLSLVETPTIFAPQSGGEFGAVSSLSITPTVGGRYPVGVYLND